MKRLALALFLAACNPTPKEVVKGEPSAMTTQALPAAASPVEAATKLRLVPADPDADALALIRTERLKAKAEGRVLVVYVSATWCDPCKKLKEEIEAGRLDARLGKTTLLAFDADKDLDRLGAAGYTFEFVPYVALPGADGHPAETQEATGKGASAWKELLAKLDAWQTR